MSNIIHVSPEKLIQSASEFERTAGEIRALTSNMTAIIGQLSGRVWSGEAANAYRSKFNNLQGDINRLYTMVSTQATHLRQIAQEYKIKEAENTAEAGTLSGSVIA